MCADVVFALICYDILVFMLKLKSNEPLESNQSRRPTAYYSIGAAEKSNQNLRKTSVSPAKASSYVDGRRMSAMNVS